MARRRMLALLCPLALWTPWPATLSPAAAAEAIEEIVVTARGRAEARRSVPDTLTVFGSAAIERRRIETVDELAKFTPGVFIVNDQDPGTNLITIRGVSTNRQQSASIAYVIDGVQLADTEFFTRRLYDLERAEILKGPQGALYGRSAIGGVFNIVTKQPSATAQGRAEITYGNGETVEFDGGLGGPLLGERLTARAAVSYRDSDGFIDNGFLRRKVDGFESLNGRLTLAARPFADLTVTVKAEAAREEAGAAFVSSGDVTGDFGGRLDGAALIAPFGDFPGRSERDWVQVAGIVDWALPVGGTLTSISAYDSYDKDFVEELDFRNGPITLFGLPFPAPGLAPIRQPVAIEAATQELRYVSPETGRLSWIAGGFFQSIDRARTDDFGPLLFGAEAPRFDLDITQFALFGQVAYDITETLEVTAALRWDRDEREQSILGAETGALFDRGEAAFDKVQPKLSLAWQAGAQTLLYATWAKGFKPGGFNPLPGAGDIFDRIFPAEETSTVELGAKTRLWDGRAEINLAGFLTDYENLQTTIFLSGNNVVLAAEAVDISGVEGEVRLQPLAWLGLYAAVAYTETDIERFVVPDPLNPSADLDLSGKEVPHSPRWTVNAGVEAARAAGPGRLLGRLDVIGTGVTFFEVDNVLFTPPRWTVDGRLAYGWGGYELALWGRNLFDDRFAVSAFGQNLIPLLTGLGPGGPFDSFTVNRGREFGVTAAARF